MIELINMNVFLTFRLRYILILSILLIVPSCASTGRTEPPEGISFEKAIEQSANEIIDRIRSGTRIAIVAFSSENENVSNYIMDEIAGVFVDGRLEVVDRRNLSYVYRELNFQMSGDVSDETAVSIGKFLGAQYVITGQFIRAGNYFRFLLSCINVETAVYEASSRLNVSNDRALQNLINDISRSYIVITTADYNDQPNASLRTAGKYFDRGMFFLSRGEWDSAMDLSRNNIYNFNTFLGVIL